MKIAIATVQVPFIRGGAVQQHTRDISTLCKWRQENQ